MILVPFLARYRPEVHAFLLPSGQFMFPAQLDLPGPLVAGLTWLATNQLIKYSVLYPFYLNQ